MVIIARYRDKSQHSPTSSGGTPHLSQQAQTQRRRPLAGRAWPFQVQSEEKTDHAGSLRHEERQQTPPFLPNEDLSCKILPLCCYIILLKACYPASRRLFLSIPLLSLFSEKEQKRNFENNVRKHDHLIQIPRLARRQPRLRGRQAAVEKSLSRRNGKKPTLTARISHCGICGSNVNTMRSGWGGRPKTHAAWGPSSTFTPLHTDPEPFGENVRLLTREILHSHEIIGKAVRVGSMAEEGHQVKPPP